MQAPVVAFVYAFPMGVNKLVEDIGPVYETLVSGLVDNVKSVFGNVEVVHITDETTRGAHGCSVMRVKRKVNPMPWRLICMDIAHFQYPEILFTEPDVRFEEDVMEVFDNDFDVTVCDREKKTLLNGEEVVPITLGMNFSRCGKFWRDAAKNCLNLPHKQQLWGGDMTSVYSVMDKYNVLTLSAKTYNHIPESPEDKGEKATHYSGRRKTWLFPLVKESS